MQKTTQPDNCHDHKSPVAPKLPAASSAGQLHAATAANDARIKEAGLGGNRIGKSSASGKRDQAHRDAETETIPSTNSHSHASPDAEHPEEHPILVQVNTGHNIHGSEELNRDIQSTVNASLGRFGSRVTRVEIHLSDDNGSKSHGDDKRCLLEARPAGMRPVVVTAVAATIDDALDDTVDKMARLLESTFEKLHDPKGHTSLGEDMAI
jgi:hypothetical protein